MCHQTSREPGSSSYIVYKNGTSSAASKPVTTSSLTPYGKAYPPTPVQVQIQIRTTPSDSNKE